MDLPTLTYVSTLLTIISVVIGFVGYVRGWWESPERKEERARQKSMADALLGEAAVLDRQGKELDPGNPGLVHRVSQVEEAVVEFRHMTGLLTEVLGRVDAIEHDHKEVSRRVDDHDTAIASLIASTFERGANAALAVEQQRDTINGEAT